jgi:hypothetical protein
MERKKDRFRCLSCGRENPVDSIYCSYCGRKLETGESEVGREYELTKEKRIKKEENGSKKIERRPLSIILCSGMGFALGSYLVIAGITVLIIVSPALRLDLYGMESVLYSSMMYNIILVFLGFGLAFSSRGVWKGKSWSYSSVHFVVGFLVITDILMGKKYGFGIWEWLFLISEIVLLIFLNTTRARHFLSGHT